MKNRTKNHYENTNRLDIQRKKFVIIITCQQICEQKTTIKKIKLFFNSFMTEVSIK